MRIVPVIVTAFILLSPASAAELHKATPLDVLLSRYHDQLPAHSHDGDAHHHHVAPPEASSVVEVEVDDATAAATRTFTVTARQFSFTIDPSPFVVNQGDMVTLTIRNADVTHGFFLERYAEDFDGIPNGGRTRTFVANQPGSFTYFCTISSCGSGHGSMFGTFVVNAAQSQPPTITGFSPASGPSTGGTNVTITGTNFVNGATVRFGNSSSVGLVSFISSSALVATSPAQTTDASVSIMVTNPDGQSATSPTQFVYTQPGPSISSVSPSSGSTAGGTNITITGNGFQSGATVTIGNTPATNVVIVSSSMITATTPLGPSDAAGSTPRDVVVINPGGFGATRTGGFTYTLPPPSIASIGPPVSALAGGNRITIAGMGFTTGLPTTVMFGGVAGTELRVLSPILLSVNAPAHPAGTVDVVVQVGSNSATSTGSFKYDNTTPPRRRATRH